MNTKSNISLELDVGSDRDAGIAEWKTQDGLLDISFEDWKALQLVELLSLKIRAKTWESVPTPEIFQYIHRSSRICHELLTDSKITMVDKNDADILHDLPSDHNTKSLIMIMSKVRLFLRDTNTSISTADHFAKNIEALMES